MIFMLDMTLPPSIDEAAAMARLGYTACGVYIGGIRVALAARIDISDTTQGTKWKQIDGIRYPVRDIAPSFTSGFLPIYVARNLPWDSVDNFNDSNGYSDAHDANIQTGACGFGSDTPICLDIEAASSQGVPWHKLDEYLLGFVRGANEVGHPCGVYGLVDYCAHLQIGEQVDFTWMADPQFEGLVDALPNGNYDPSEPPASTGWQYGGGTVAGMAVDYNSFLDSFVFASYGG